MTTDLFRIPEILACRFERESLEIVVMSARLEVLLADFLAVNPQGATVLDLVQPQELAKLERGLRGSSATAVCRLNSSDSPTVQFRFHEDPQDATTHGLLIGELAVDAEDRVNLLQEKLEAAVSERSRFVDLNGLLVHDLRNALQVLLSHTHLSKKSLERRDLEDLDRRLGILTSSATTMAEQLNELNKYLRLEVGDYPKEVTDLTALVDACSSRAQKTCERPLVIERRAALPTVVCERQLITELFSNLIGNAIRYTETDPIRIEIGLNERPDASPAFFVRDTGVGIHPDDLPHVFTPLRRSDRNRLNSRGSGMGLAYVKQIVERHQGEIWLESTLNQGTTVHFSLGPSLIL